MSANKSSPASINGKARAMASFLNALRSVIILRTAGIINMGDVLSMNPIIKLKLPHGISYLLHL